MPRAREICIMECPNCHSLVPDGSRFCNSCGMELDLSGRLSAGELLAGRYQVEEILGRGRHGSVYAAHDKMLDEPVALKVINPALLPPGVGRSGLVNQAKLWRSMRLRGVLKLLDLSATQEYVFLVMELGEGYWLRAVMDQRKRSAKAWTVENICGLMAKLCDVLEDAREVMSHGELKPQNILIGKDKGVFLTDFGVACALLRKSDSSEQRYMAPELRNPGVLPTPAADVFSLGVLTYELLTGRVPDEIPQPVSAVRQDKARELDAVLKRALSASPSERFSSPGEFRDVLLRACGLSLSEKPSVVSTAVVADGVSVELVSPKVAELAERAVLPTGLEKAGSKIDPASGLPTRVKRVKDGVEMVLVPAGEFIMGSDAHNAEESPAHVVYLDAFYMDVAQTTNQAYRAFVESGQGKPPDGWKDKRFRQAYLPVVGVSFAEAQSYAHWAGAELPTEAQWEKAARGTDARFYPWGDEWDGRLCNVLDSPRSKKMPTPVGSFPEGRSPYGLYDMAGNVFQWCLDWFDPKYYAHSPMRNPSGPESGHGKACRGGAFGYPAANARSTARTPVSPILRYEFVGFRCVVTIAR